MSTGLEANAKRTFDQNSSRSEPRLALVCAQTADGCKEMLGALKDHESNIEFQALLAENALHSPDTHPFRGFALLNSKRSLITVKVSACSSKTCSISIRFNVEM